MRKIAHVLSLAAIGSMFAQSTSSYRIAHTYTLGGDGGWAGGFAWFCPGVSVAGASWAGQRTAVVNSNVNKQAIPKCFRIKVMIAPNG